MPRMTHPDGGRRVIDVAPDQVPMYESQGWVRQATKKRSAPSITPAESGSTTDPRKG